MPTPCLKFQSCLSMAHSQREHSTAAPDALADPGCRMRPMYGDSLLYCQRRGAAFSAKQAVVRHVETRCKLIVNYVVVMLLFVLCDGSSSNLHALMENQDTSASPARRNWLRFQHGTAPPTRISARHDEQPGLGDQCTPERGKTRVVCSNRNHLILCSTGDA